MTTDAQHTRFDMLARISGMPPSTGSTHTLTQFLPVRGTERAYAAALRYVAWGGDPPAPLREHHFLTIAGEPGRGKTHLALAIGWHHLGQGRGTVRYWQVTEFLDAMRAEFSNPPRDNYGNVVSGVFEYAKGCNLLIVDDLGVEKATDWAVDRLDTLINHRWLEGQLTVFTTNLTPDKLQPRVRSRIKEGVTVMVGGHDYRAMKAQLRKMEDANG